MEPGVGGDGAVGGLGTCLNAPAAQQQGLVTLLVQLPVRVGVAPHPDPVLVFTPICSVVSKKTIRSLKRKTGVSLLAKSHHQELKGLMDIENQSQPAVTGLL